MASIWALLPSTTANQGQGVTGVAADRLGERIVDDLADRLADGREQGLAFLP
jgi:hypothetical protein